MNIRCPHCATLYRIDPIRVPPGGVRARCARCAQVFAVAPSTVAEPAIGSSSPTGFAAQRDSAPAVREFDAAPETARAPEIPATPSAATAARRGPSAFGPQDPDLRAQRLARALVSDIVAYHPERRDRSLAAGTLRTEFRDEIVKSWEEFVLQIGSEMANEKPYFREALNAILARGQAIF